METVDNLQPDMDEVLQEQEAPEAVHAIPVQIAVSDVPVGVQDLPRRAGSTRTKLVDVNGPYQIAFADHYRAELVIVADAPIWVWYGTELNAATDTSVAAKWPANTPLRCRASVNVFVAAQSGTANVSYIVEKWAAGR